MLGDRLMAHDVTGKDNYRYHVGRYVQFSYDAHPRIWKKINKVSRQHPEAMQCFVHKITDLTDEAIAYRRTSKMTTPLVSATERNAEFLTALKKIKEERDSQQLGLLK